MTENDVKDGDRRPNRLSVAAIGTSNFILRRGLRHPLQSDERINFKNLSIGASGSILLGKVLDEVNFNDYDILLIDFAVNEESFFHEGSSSIEAVINALGTAIDRACRAGCLPVLLVMPNLKYIRRPRAADAMRGVFQEVMLPTFDVVDIVEKANLFTDVGIRNFFRDHNHLKPTVARAIGTLLTEILISIPIERKAPLRETGSSFKPVRYIEASELLSEHHERVFRRATRLVAADGILMLENEQLTVPEQNSLASVVGVLANAARTRGVLEADDRERLAFSVPDARWRDDPDAFVLIARPVPPVRIPRGGKAFKVVSSTTELAGPAQIELCGLFVRSDKAPARMAITPMPGRWRDLNAHIDETALRMIATLALAED